LRTRLLYRRLIASFRSAHSASLISRVFNAWHTYRSQRAHEHSLLEHQVDILLDQTNSYLLSLAFTSL